VEHLGKQVVNLTDDRRHILQFFSQACRRYYLIYSYARFLILFMTMHKSGMWVSKLGQAISAAQQCPKLS
ncbi:MAG: hypothetical protein AAF652_15100, partial [Cyanobacteria bacterium P01_C01_bin.72]